MKLIKLYFDVNMSRGHNGLGEMLGRTRLSHGECAVFVNKRWTALKMMTPDNVVLHLKMDGNDRINPDTIRYLPYCVEGNEIKYQKALKSTVTSQYKKRFPRLAAEVGL